MAEVKDPAKAKQQKPAKAEEHAADLRITWDDSEMGTLFANAVNASSTLEEFMLFFGTNQTWNPSAGGVIRVKLNQRVILSPHAAKRLAVLLNSVLAEYERRFGTLKVEGRLRPPGEATGEP